MKNILFLSALTLLLCSCVNKRTYPRMISFTPVSVVIDYSDNDLHEATNLAQQYCSSMQKDAQYVRTEDSDTRNGFFNCVERSYNKY